MSRFIGWIGARFRVALLALFPAVAIAVSVWPVGANFFEGPPLIRSAFMTVAAFLLAVSVPRRFPAVGQVVLSAAAGTLLLLFLLADPSGVADVPTDWNVLDLWVDVIAGWENILSTAVPAEPSSRLLAFPLATCWVATHVTVILTMRGVSAFVSGLPLLATTFGFLLLGPGEFTVVPAIATAVCFLIHLAIGAARTGDDHFGGFTSAAADARGQLWRYAIRSFLLVGLPTTAIAVAAGVALTLGTGADPNRVDLHRLSGITVDEEVTPLARVRAQLLEESQDLFTVHLTVGDVADGLVVDRVRIATLDRYDGALFTAGNGLFLPVTDRVRRPHTPARATTPVSVEIRLTPAYQSSYLPVVGLLRNVNGVQLGLNEGSDTLVTGLAPGSPATILLTSVVPTGLRPAIDSEAPPPSGAGPYDLAEVKLPESFDRFLESVAADADPIRRLYRLEETMKSADQFGYSVDNTYSGHSLPVLDAYLSPEPRPGFEVHRQGFAEQSATAFTLLARRLGFASRVAVGYLIPDPEALLQDETVVVTSNNAHAWSEVYLGDEWVMFDPTNREDRDVDDLSLSEFSEETSSDQQEEFEQVAPMPELDTAPTPRPLPWKRTLLLGGLVLLLLTPAAAKVIRRALRRRGHPDRRIIGAWRELRDRSRDSGIPVTRSMGPRDLGRHLTNADSDADLELFSSCVDAALFAERPPDDAQADMAWRLITPIQRGTAHRRSWPWRIVAAANPRSLRPPSRGEGRRLVVAATVGSGGHQQEDSESLRRGESAGSRRERPEPSVAVVPSGGGDPR